MESDDLKGKRRAHSRRFVSQSRSGRSSGWAPSAAVFVFQQRFALACFQHTSSMGIVSVNEFRTSYRQPALSDVVSSAGHSTLRRFKRSLKSRDETEKATSRSGTRKRAIRIPFLSFRRAKYFIHLNCLRRDEKNRVLHTVRRISRTSVRFEQARIRSTTARQVRPSNSAKRAR